MRKWIHFYINLSIDFDLEKKKKLFFTLLLAYPIHFFLFVPLLFESNCWSSSRSVGQLKRVRVIIHLLLMVIVLSAGRSCGRRGTSGWPRCRRSCGCSCGCWSRSGVEVCESGGNSGWITSHWPYRRCRSNNRWFSYFNGFNNSRDDGFISDQCIHPRSSIETVFIVAGSVSSNRLRSSFRSWRFIGSSCTHRFDQIICNFFMYLLDSAHIITS